MKKKNGAEICWATAQLCHNTMGNCIVTQQVLGVQWVQLYCNIVRLDGLESVLQHGIMYCSWEAGRVCHNTPSVLSQERLVGWGTVLQDNRLYCD